MDIRIYCFQKLICLKQVINYKFRQENRTTFMMNMLSLKLLKFVDDNFLRKSMSENT